MASWCFVSGTFGCRPFQLVIAIRFLFLYHFERGPNQSWLGKMSVGKNGFFRLLGRDESSIGWHGDSFTSWLETHGTSRRKVVGKNNKKKRRRAKKQDADMVNRQAATQPDAPTADAICKAVLFLYEAPKIQEDEKLSREEKRDKKIRDKKFIRKSKGFFSFYLASSSTSSSCYVWLLGCAATSARPLTSYTLLLLQKRRKGD